MALVPKETFTRLQLAAVSSISIEFHGFQGQVLGGLSKRDPGPEEAFARSQLAAIS